MVCTFSPPGVSSAGANSRRARARRFGVRLARRSTARIASSSAASSSVVQSRERVEHAVRHVGGGGLGEGEAEDFRRVDAVEQQADHALRQHMGLARAGIGRRPRPRRRDRTAAMLHARRTSSGNDARRLIRLALVLVGAAGQRPFLHARQMVVVAVARLPHRMHQRDDRASPRRRSASTSAVEPRQRLVGLRVGACRP